MLIFIYLYQARILRLQPRRRQTLVHAGPGRGREGINGRLLARRLNGREGSDVDIV